eukprot:TRINITY_DN26894_c0_g1_i2.p1 TRINITY_DN26894_c0_g1~~TRINITY_DN26894_c0_g1_i2.p1  ORF type:complete len:366 (+),score=116.51 TRINITY_DN26894_c0_g1_i2:83-1099(+)
MGDPAEQLLWGAESGLSAPAELAAAAASHPRLGDSAGAAQQQPGLAWVLLTRLDGLLLAALLGAAIWLLLRALATLQQQLEATLRESSSSPPPQPPAGESAELAAELQAARLELAAQGRELVLLREGAAEGERRVAAAEEELQGVYALAAAESGRGADPRELRAACEARDAAVDTAQRAASTVLALRDSVGRREERLVAARDRARELEASAADLRERLLDAEDRLASSAAVWDMVVQQYGRQGRRAAPSASPAPRLRSAADPATPWGLLQGQQQPQHRGRDAARRVGAAVEQYPARRGGSPPAIYRGSARWGGADGGDSQAAYLRSLDEQIAALQQSG